jgi:hypothetical protein
MANNNVVPINSNSINYTVTNIIDKKIHDIIWDAGKSGGKFKLKLTFKFDDNIYSTIFNISIHRNNDNIIYAIEITNNCINITLQVDNKSEWYIVSEASGISKNTEEKRCFSPVLSSKTLPPGVSMADLLQVLSTKLKTALFPNETTFAIYDFAKITKSTKNNISKTPYFSAWRLLRGEPAIYDKYGYESPHFNAIKDYVKTVKLDDIHPDAFEKLHSERPDIFNRDNGDKTIAELMKLIEYDSKANIVIIVLFDAITGVRP